jgi:hypothetical protein
MSYTLIGTDDKGNKVYSDSEFAYYAKTPQEIFDEKAAAYAKQTPQTITIPAKGKKAARTVVTPILTVSAGGKYKKAVNAFKPEDFSAYKKTDYDIKKVNAKGFDQKIAYNQLRANQATEKTRIDGLIEKQRNEANQAAFQNRLDVKEELFKRLNNPIQQQGTIQQIPYTSSGGYSEIFNKIAGKGNRDGQRIPMEQPTQMPLTTPVTPAAPETPMQKQALAAINQNVGGTNNTQNFTMPNTTGLTFGGS